MKKILIIVGLPGSGKTTAIQNLSKQREIATFDFDEVMPEALRAKMKAGKVISDEERTAFFEKVIQSLKDLAKDQEVAAACVLVKEQHRKMFLDALPTAVIVKLHVPLSILKQRISQRQHSFFNPEALEILAKQDEASSFVYREIDGSLSEEEISDRLLSILEEN